jgi:Zn-dependent peptidase ImmA (M78 family)
VAASLPALVEPAVLRWARESIGLTTLAAERKLGLPEGRVEAWEASEATPMIAQLRAAANVYKRPLGVFFLPEPPTEFDAMRDFRRHVGASAGAWSPELHGEFRRAQAQREFALELAELEDETLSTDWRLADLPDDDEHLATAAREVLLRHAPLRLPEAAATPYEHLNAWVAALEESGVLVLATSHGGVTTQEMRAFSLFFDSLPVIVVNGSDSPRGRLFSLLHEYSHLLLHTGGLCDTVTDQAATTTDRRLEARCNAVAAAILMPRQPVLAMPGVGARRRAPDSWSYEALRSAAAPFGASAEAFLRRLVTLDLVPAAFYQARREDFLTAYADDEARSTNSGGNWYRNTARDLGKGYVRKVASAHRRRIIDSYTAASFLNVKVGQIGRLAEAAALQTTA